MSEVDGIIERYHHLVGCRLERYQGAVEETDAAEVSSFLSLLIYQHLEARGHIETFMAPQYQEPEDIADGARNLVERELFTSVEHDKGDLTLLLVVYAMRQVNWMAVAEVIADEIADRRLRHQRTGGQGSRPLGVTMLRLGPFDLAPSTE
jgi:hypothetical protein